MLSLCEGATWLELSAWRVNAGFPARPRRGLLPGGVVALNLVIPDAQAVTVLEGTERPDHLFLFLSSVHFSFQ